MMKAWLSAGFSANQLHPRVCFCGVVLTTGISKVAAQTGSFAPVGFGNSNHRKFHPRMAQVQHDPELSSARQSHLENTTANRPSAAQSEKTEEELKRYTCLYFGYASNLSPVTLNSAVQILSSSVLLLCPGTDGSSTRPDMQTSSHLLIPMTMFGDLCVSCHIVMRWP